MAYDGGMPKAKKKPAKLGRPLGTGRYGKMIRAMVEPEMVQAVEAWKKREGAASVSEAIRDLLNKVLKTEGLL